MGTHDEVIRPNVLSQLPVSPEAETLYASSSASILVSQQEHMGQ